MNGDTQSVAELMGAIKVGLGNESAGVRVAVCPPTLYLGQVRVHSANSAIALGAQDVSEHVSGAFTGQHSAPMLREFGVSLALVGHSERRHGLGESDDLVARKAKACLAYMITPVVCVGEQLQERESGNAVAVVTRQLGEVLALLGAQATQMIVAYEPVWAIGTGKTATPQDAQAIHAALHSQLKTAGAANVPILYGGSVKADNASALFSQSNIDGALVGGAALDAASFCAIAQAA